MDREFILKIFIVFSLSEVDHLINTCKEIAKLSQEGNISNSDNDYNYNMILLSLSHKMQYYGIRTGLNIKELYLKMINNFTFNNKNIYLV